MLAGLSEKSVNARPSASATAIRPIGTQLKEKSRHSAEVRNCVMLPTLLALEASPDRLMPAKDL